MKKEISKYQHFANDADGLSMVDIISVIMIVFFIGSKLFHIGIATKYSGTNMSSDVALVMADINEYTKIVMLFYFGKKTMDTTITKVGLFRAGEYHNRGVIDDGQPDDPRLIRNDPNNITEKITKSVVSSYDLTKEAMSEMTDDVMQYIAPKPHTAAASAMPMSDPASNVNLSKYDDERGV